MWLWTTRLMPSRPSRSGEGEPDVTNAAAVSGTSPAESRRSKVQWCDPTDLWGGGKVVGSFAEPLNIAESPPKSHHPYIVSHVGRRGKGGAVGELAMCWKNEEGHARPPGT
jgi:hypothetical protein